MTLQAGEGHGRTLISELRTDWRLQSDMKYRLTGGADLLARLKMGEVLADRPGVEERLGHWNSIGHAHRWD